MHWACEKITASASLPDTVLLEGLLDKVCVYYIQAYTLILLPGKCIRYCRSSVMSPCFTSLHVLSIAAQVM